MMIVPMPGMSEVRLDAVTREKGIIQPKRKQGCNKYGRDYWEDSFNECWARFLSTKKLRWAVSNI